MAFLARAVGAGNIHRQSVVQRHVVRLYGMHTATNDFDVPGGKFYIEA